MSDYKYDNKIFIDRASELIFNSGKTQAELVELLGLSNGSIANLKNKEGQIPSAKTICALAKNFNVSTDWLLGLTDVKTTDKATKELCDTLGLSEKSIEILREQPNDFIGHALDWLIFQHLRSKNQFWQDISDYINNLQDEDMKQELKANCGEMPGQYERSILYNVYRLLILPLSSKGDVLFQIAPDAITVTQYAGETPVCCAELNSTGGIAELFENNNVVSLKSLLLEETMRLINQEFSSLVNQGHIRIGKMMLRKAEEELYGNDKKEE